MEFFNTIVLPLVTTVLGGMSLSQFMTIRSLKRKASAEAKSEEIDNDSKILANYKEQILFLNQQLEEAYRKNNDMQTIINENRDQILKVMREAQKLEISLVEEEKKRISAESKVCNNDMCNNRS